MNKFAFSRKPKMIKVELSVSPYLYTELGFYPKMTLIRSETGAIKFVPTSEELLNSLASRRTNSDKEESEKPYWIDKEVSSLPTSSLKTKEIESDSSKTMFLEKWSGKMSKHSSEMTDQRDVVDESLNSDSDISASSADVGFTNTNKPPVIPCTMYKKRLPIKHSRPIKNYTCEYCKFSFKTNSGYYQHKLKCASHKKAALNKIEALKAKPSKESEDSFHLESNVSSNGVDPSDNISTFMNEDDLNYEKQGSAASWTLATRIAAGTIDAPAYFCVKKS